ncbi:hypothetical protein Pla163_08180 [Planctomycetes bacterium Pla163]|uniref:Sulfatase n=1 Tax=Rohdeia mirabilis TaxID=2528008 RepID=A0A518CWW2_9BACT|nr:hypothetical protein Pla163_08180 [Planctomycetes bacterium Pla163]
MNPFQPNRRAFIRSSLMGAGSLGLGSLLGRTAFASVDDALAIQHHPATAKRVLVLFMSGGPSQFELFDNKPLLNERRGEQLPDSVRQGKRITEVTVLQGALPIVGSPFEFARHGECGMELSELVPGLAQHADDLTLVRSMQTDTVIHETATTFFFTGSQLLGRPSMGSWVTYALGSECENLPEFTVLVSGSSRDDQGLHSRLWGSGFLPGRYQGVPFRSSGDAVLYLSNPDGVEREHRKGLLEGLERLNELEAERTGDPDVHTRINTYEMAAKMQLSVPELTDLSTESEDTIERYGANPQKPSFANNCLMARRLLERGVRFVQLCDRGWDHHGGLPKSLKEKCEVTDKPIGALLTDLKNSGLLDDTIVVFAGEFGRTPYCEGRLTRESYGRDHNNRVGSMWLAGGGMARGATLGTTDDWGWDTVDFPVHVHDIQATLLHCLGIDHLKLTRRHQGRDFRLTDVSGRVVPEMLAGAPRPLEPELGPAAEPRGEV